MTSIAGFYHQDVAGLAIPGVVDNNLLAVAVGLMRCACYIASGHLLSPVFQATTEAFV